MWTWIRKNIFRVYRGGKHRTEGLSTLERAMFTGDIYRPVKREANDMATLSPYSPESRKALRDALSASSVPVPSGTEVVSQRLDYVPEYQDYDETRLTAEDWTN